MAAGADDVAAGIGFADLDVLVMGSGVGSGPDGKVVLHARILALRRIGASHTG